MTHIIRILLIAVLLPVLSVGCASSHSKQFWEIRDQQLPFIAMIRADPRFGTVVIYNPDTCEQIGAACMFFRAHAHAHQALSHTILANPHSYPDSLEEQADCFASRNVDPHEVQAAVALMRDENRDPDIPITGNPLERAERIEACAREDGNWIASQ